MKKYRILITPNVAARYDQRMVTGFAEGFTRIGHFAVALSCPISSAEVVRLCKHFSIDVVIQINRARDPEVSLPDGVRLISWFQDVFPETIKGFPERFKDSDILYVLGDAEVLGLNAKMPCFSGSLFTGVDQATINFLTHNIKNDLDFSLCGGLPPAFDMASSYKNDILWHVDNLLQKVPSLGASRFIEALRILIFSQSLPVDYLPSSVLLAMAQVVQSSYRPLRGELDIHVLSEAIFTRTKLLDCEKVYLRNVRETRTSKLSRFLTPYAQRYSGRRDFEARLIRYLAKESRIFHRGPTSPVGKAINYFAQSYPRIMDRVALVAAAEKVSRSLELYGPGLDSHTFAHPYFKGVIEDQDCLLKMYLRSRINLHNSTHGLGLHSRTLECMAVGGFVFMHESSRDSNVGGMHTEFEPGAHYGAYTPENFHEEALRWLADERRRISAGVASASIIRRRHCWHHRAQQVINDLNR